MRRSPPVPPLDDADLLAEIILRLPPQPSSLPRASAVCKRWRSLASDPAFSRRFRRHHRRSPPLLGFFQKKIHSLSFVPTLDAPNHVRPGRFSLQLHDNFDFFDSRHGLVLIFDLQFLVWDPVTGQQHRLPTPPGFDPTKTTVQGAVLCSPAPAPAEHFKVVLLVAERHYKDRLKERYLACVYSSQTGVWSKNLISTPFIGLVFFSHETALLVGDSLYWKFFGGSRYIIEFALERESISVIPVSPHVHSDFILIRAQGCGGLGLLSVSNLDFTAHLWKRNAHSDDIVVSWEVGTTIELDKLLSLDSDVDKYPRTLSYAEDNNLVLMHNFDSMFSLQLESLQSKTLPRPTELHHDCHTFESVYAAGI